MFVDVGNCENESRVIGECKSLKYRKMRRELRDDLAWYTFLKCYDMWPFHSVRHP